MPELRPIHAVRYAPPRASPGANGGVDVSSKIAPPYDVLDAGPKADLLARDPHNVVAIDLPVTPPKTVGPDSAYAAAGELYRRWLGDGVLTREDLPCLVVYEQEYETVAGTGHFTKRRGLFANLGVEEFNRPGGGIFRHEMTIAGGIGDRTKLMETTQAQLSPIFGIFPDPRRTAVDMINEVCDSGEPDYQGVTGNDGVTHRCWIVRRGSTIKAFAKFFRQTDVFIADGHHRYTTALQFSEDHPELPGADQCLFVLVAAEDPGMIVRPTHRVVCGLQDFSFDRLLDRIDADDRFVVRRDDFEDVDLGHARFDLLDPEMPDYRYGIWLKGECWNRETMEAGSQCEVGLPPGPRAQLNISVLHDMFIDGLLRPNFGGDAVTFKYTADEDEMVRWAGEGTPGTDDRIGVFLQATRLEDVMAVSRANEVMPPKSTYFYPKLATGLVINPLD